MFEFPLSKGTLKLDSASVLLMHRHCIRHPDVSGRHPENDNQSNLKPET